MSHDRLTNSQRATYWTQETHGYGLGIRCPKAGGIHTDIGWGGAAGAFLAVDIPNGISIYYAQHMLSSPNQAIRSKIYEFVMAELMGKEEFKTRIKKDEIIGEYRYTF